MNIDCVGMYVGDTCATRKKEKKENFKVSFLSHSKKELHSEPINQK